ncbi:hypothetical protein [Natranaeroarchaeum aerophilus]|uniref:Uncharacterized protein n=1 Tax=Natranaeroarchaeum aerophilus TaxID=2917711 RepID=A0AAE3K746_9EURY|nr:hypothetical protein [Natranaeroarchaeum aerophilus]MCL9813494.1 hypothetical protein [Natranaeroarchaeum aerophilus]
MNDRTGYSEAPVGVDGEWRGIDVRAMPDETRVIDFDLTEQRRDDLPNGDVLGD